VNDLSDRAQREYVRAALLRAEIRDAQLMSAQLEETQGHLREHQEYIGALEGHVSGLEHNIELLNEALVASEGRYQEVLRSKSGRMPSLIRRARSKVSRISEGKSGGG
jgi:predicted nuclease with TOPRIM domain